MDRVYLTIVALTALFYVAICDECKYCHNLQCGPDGIGGSCGTCPVGQSCQRGRCVCNRDCTARQCGPDPCGTNCGECLPGQTCVDGICTGACTPQCTREVNGAAKTCGWDRCGGNCGSCPDNFRCKDGQCLCYPDCENKNCGPDGCGGTCGTCVDTEEGPAFCGEENSAFPGTCHIICDFCGDEVCSDTETSVETRSFSTGQTWCPQDCGSVTGVISLAVGQLDQLNGITVDFFNVNPFTVGDRELAGFASASVVSDSKGAFGVYNIPLSGGNTTVQDTRVYFRLRGETSDRTTGSPIRLLDLWWNFPLQNLPELNRSPNFYFYMSPLFTDSTALFRIILSWGTLIENRASTIPDVDLFVAGPVDSDTMEAENPEFRNGIVNFANKNYKSETSSTILPFAKIVADSTQGFGPEVIDILRDVRIGAPEQTIGLSRDYPEVANEVNEYEFWVDRPNSNSNQDNFQSFLADTNAFLIVYRGSSVNPTVLNEQIFFGNYENAPDFMFGFQNNDPFNDIPEEAAAWHVFNIAYRGFNTDSDITGVTSTNIFEFRNIPADKKYAFDDTIFAPTKTIPCSHSVEFGVPSNLAYCPYTIEYPRKK